MSKTVTREEMREEIKRFINPGCPYGEKTRRKLRAILRLIESRQKVSRGFVRKWTGNFGGGRFSDVGEWEIVKMLKELGHEVEK